RLDHEILRQGKELLRQDDCRKDERPVLQVGPVVQVEEITWRHTSAERLNSSATGVGRPASLKNITRSADSRRTPSDSVTFSSVIRDRQLGSCSARFAEPTLHRTLKR